MKINIVWEEKLSQRFKVCDRLLQMGPRTFSRLQSEWVKVNVIYWSTVWLVGRGHLSCCCHKPLPVIAIEILSSDEMDIAHKLCKRQKGTLHLFNDNKGQKIMQNSWNFWRESQKCVHRKWLMLLSRQLSLFFFARHINNNAHFEANEQLFFFFTETQFSKCYTVSNRICCCSAEFTKLFIDTVHLIL